MAYEKIIELPNRRPVAARRHPFFARSAHWLQHRGVRPNTVSLLSVVFAAAAGAALAASPWVPNAAAALLFVLAIFGIAGRGICNVLDGMIAVEGGLRSASGDIYNDFPDRISDTLLCLGAGYAAITLAAGPVLGWAAALGAIMTAYTRTLGASAGTAHYFLGPMAKTHRMAVLVMACLAAIPERLLLGTAWSFGVALLIIACGCVVTVIRRLRRITGELHSK